MLRRCLSKVRLLSSTVSRSTSPCSTVRSLSRLTLPDVGKTLTLDRLSVTRRLDAFSLFADAALRADNVGCDEYPTVQHLDSLLSRSNVAIVGLSDRVECVVVVTPCVYSRSVNPTLCTLTIVTSAELSAASRSTWRQLIDVGLTTIRELTTYTGCIVDVFVTCPHRVLAFRDTGFLITACVPNAGRVSGVSGYVANYIMYKDLGTGRAKTTINACPQQSESDVDPVHPNLLPVSKLPIRVTMSDGTPLHFRSMRPDEVRLFYEALRTAADEGRGYGTDELPSFRLFVSDYVDGAHNIVIELASTGAVVSYCNAGHPSQFARSARPALVDGGNMLIQPEFRGRRWYAEMGSILYRLCYGDDDAAAEPSGVSGIRVLGMLGDTAAVNLHAYNASIRMGYVIVGTLPDGIYLNDRGWVDMLLMYKPVSSGHSRL